MNTTTATATATASQRKLKYLASINDDVLGEDTDADFEMQYIDIGNVDSADAFPNSHHTGSRMLQAAPAGLSETVT